ncbi:uncharacterized protein LOC143335223 [Chaetodon auriga]|uniref:uncharacterized protein LOC143335223 n=1 Tax=Chaetodon auriga TaxID=39042 RepID=UPI004032EA45
MSADILAAPHLNVNVRYTRKVQQNRREEEENHGEILEDEEHRADVGSQTARAQAEKKPATRRCFIAAAVAVGGMYLLMLAGIFLRYITAVSERDQLQRSYDSLHNTCIQLQGNHSGMALNNSRLQSSYEAVSKNHRQLQEEVKQLKGEIEGRRCPEGWRKFGCSCYFKYSQRTSWQSSRNQCQNKEADLVVINSKEEQKFVIELSEKDESWIGLKETWKSTRWVWGWVDGSPLTQTFWASGLQNDGNQYAACCDQQGKLTRRKYHDYTSGICEK